MDPRGARVAMPPGGQADLVTDSLPAEPDGSPDDEHAVAAGAHTGATGSRAAGEVVVVMGTSGVGLRPGEAGPAVVPATMI